MLDIIRFLYFNTQHSKNLFSCSAHNIMFRLIYTARKGSAYLIKKYPNGLGNRMQLFDEWTKTWNDPNIKCYYDYFHNLENPRFQAFIPDSASSKNDLAQAVSRHRPVIGKLN